MTVDNNGSQRRGTPEILFLGFCGVLTLVAVILLIMHPQDLAPLVASVTDTFEAWQRDLELFLEVLRGADPEELRERR